LQLLSPLSRLIKMRRLWRQLDDTFMLLLLLARPDIL
jgi:hypothetical protein